MDAHSENYGRKNILPRAGFLLPRAEKSSARGVSTRGHHELPVEFRSSHPAPFTICCTPIAVPSFRSPSASHVAPPADPLAMAWGFLGGVLGRIALRPAKDTTTGARDAVVHPTVLLPPLSSRSSFSRHRDAAGDAAEGELANAIEVVRDAPSIVRAAETSRRRNRPTYPRRRRLPFARRNDIRSRGFLLRGRCFGGLFSRAAVVPGCAPRGSRDPPARATATHRRFGPMWRSRGLLLRAEPTDRCHSTPPDRLVGRSEVFPPAAPSVSEHARGGLRVADRLGHRSRWTSTPRGSPADRCAPVGDHPRRLEDVISGLTATLVWTRAPRPRIDCACGEPPGPRRVTRIAGELVLGEAGSGDHSRASHWCRGMLRRGSFRG